MQMDTVHITHPTDSSLSYFSNWVDQNLINHKQKSVDEFLDKFNKKFGNVVECAINKYLEDLAHNLNVDNLDLNIESHMNVEKNTAKLLVILKKFSIKNQEIILKLSLCLINILDFFSQSSKPNTNGTIILTGTKLTDIHRKIIEQSTKCLPFIISNFECSQDTLYMEILRVIHSLIENKFTSQITLTLVDTLLSIQSIVYCDELKKFLLAKFRGENTTDSFLAPCCRRFYNGLFNSNKLSVTGIGVARAIMMMDYTLLDYGQDIMFLGFQPGVSIDMTQMSLIGMQSYLSSFIHWYKNEQIPPDPHSFASLSNRFMKLIKVLINVWESRARRSSHLAISLYEEVIKFLASTKETRFLKIASDASEYVLNQFNHRKKLYYTSVDITIPFLGVHHFLEQNPDLVLELIASMGELNTRSIATKLLRRIFINILSEFTLEDFRRKFYPLIATVFKNNLPLRGADSTRKLSEFSQTSITNCILDMLSCFDNDCYLYILYYMQLEQSIALEKTKYGYLLILDENANAQGKEIHITSEMTIAESIILLTAKIRNKLSLYNINSQTFIKIGDEASLFRVSPDRIIYSILSNEYIRINTLEAMILSPKLIQPNFIDSFLALLGIKTSFTIASQEFKQLEIVLFTNFFNRFKSYTKTISDLNFNSVDLSKFEHLDIVKKIKLIESNSDVTTWFIHAADHLLSDEFFIGANFDRLEAALKISQRLIEILIDEYIEYSDFQIVKAILNTFEVIADQLLDLAFNILMIIPNDVILKVIPEKTFKLVDYYLGDIRPLYYVRGSYLHLLQSIVKSQGKLTSEYPLKLMEKCSEIIESELDFLEDYFSSMSKPQSEDLRFDSPAGFLYEFIVTIDYFKRENIELNVLEYIKALKLNLVKLGKYIIDKNTKNLSLFDCRGHIIHSYSTDYSYKEYYLEDLGAYKFGIFRPKRRLKFVKTPFSECVTSLIWKSLSLLIAAATSLVNYIFPKCKKSNKWDCINYKIINYELLEEIYCIGDFIITLLLNSRHLGLIDSCIDFLNAIVPKLKSGFKMPTEEYVFKWYDKALNILNLYKDAVGNKNQLSLYKFDNLSSCIASLLGSQSKLEDKNLSTLIFALLNNSLPKLYSLDLLRTIVKSSRLSYFLNNYIYDILYYSLECITDDDWSVANSASLLFSACISYMDVISPSISKTSPQNRNLSEMFNCNDKLKDLIISSLDPTSVNNRQMALVLVLIIKFSGGDEFIFMLYDLLSFKDDGIRNLVSIGIAKYSSTNNFYEYLEKFDKWHDFNLIHGLLLTIEKITESGEYAKGESIRTWLLRLFAIRLPFPILPSLLYLANKFIIIEKPLKEYKNLLQIVLSSFGQLFFNEVLKHLDLDLLDFKLEYIPIGTNPSLKSASLPFLFNLLEALEVKPNDKIVKLMEVCLGDMHIDLSPIGEDWYILGPKLLSKRLDESCLTFCYKHCHNNPADYLPILVDILAKEAYAGYTALSVLSQLTIRIISLLHDKSNDSIDELLELGMGVVQVVTDDHTYPSIKTTFLESLAGVNIDINGVHGRFWRHLWTRLIYMLQDESSDVRRKTSEIICDKLYNWGLIDKRLNTLWYITEDLASGLTNTDKPLKIYNTNYKIDVTKRRFALFNVESPNIYRERTF